MHYNHLTREHRYAIYLGSEEGKRHEAIARQINVHSSSICVKTCCKSIFFFVLQLAYGTGKCGHLQGMYAGEQEHCPNFLKEALSLLINEDWSPKQISGYFSLKSEHISHETIYKRIRRHTPHDRKRPLRMKTNLNLSGNTYQRYRFQRCAHLFY